MQLYPHQKKAVEESHDKWGLWFKMRVGKTATSISLANNRAKSALIISPKQVKSNWAREVNNWSNGNCDFYIISKENMRTGKNVQPGCDAIIIDECFTGDTEILTDNGFIRFDSLDKTEMIAQYDMLNKNIQNENEIQQLRTSAHIRNTIARKRAKHERLALL